MEEKEIWNGSPSQWTNFGTYAMCIIFCLLIFPIFIVLWRFLVVKTWKIKITDQRLIEEKGVLSKTTEELEAEAREWRNNELKDTDFIIPLSDYPNRDAWITYRQELRDWTDTSDFPATKPTKP